MTRRQKAPRSTATITAEPTPLSAAIRRAIDSIREPFDSFVTSFKVVSIDRDKFAPKFMKVFAAWAKETTTQTGRRAQFVEFVRLLDPSIGPSRKDYRSHPTYWAADYLRRKMSPTATPHRGPKPATPLDATARALASTLQLVPNTERETLWKALTTALHWTPRQVSGLQKRAENAAPLVDFRTPHGTNLPALKLVQPRAA